MFKLLIVFCLAITPAYAADSTVTALPAASALSGAELFYCVQSAADAKCTANQIKTFTSASPTFTGTATLPDSSTITSNGHSALGIGASAPASGVLDSANGAASLPALILNGAIFTGGSGTTTFPQFLIQPSTATASTTWSTTGTAFGINAHTGVGNLMDLQLDGTSNFKVTAAGTVTVAANLTVGAANQISFSARGILSSPAVGKMQIGTIDAASPVAQTLQAQSVSAGNTNTAGATFIIGGSKSNGSGGGDVLLQTTLSSAGSGTQNALATALTLKGGTQNVIHSALSVLAGYTVSTLPAGVVGGTAYVTDQLTTCAVAGATLTGGGAVTCPVFYNGSAWVGG